MPFREAHKIYDECINRLENRIQELSLQMEFPKGYITRSPHTVYCHYSRTSNKELREDGYEFIRCDGDPLFEIWAKL